MPAVQSTCGACEGSQRSSRHIASSVQTEIEILDDLARFRLPDGVQDRLNTLLDKQDGGQRLTDSAQREAEGLVNLYNSSPRGYFRGH